MMKLPSLRSLIAAGMLLAMFPGSLWGALPGYQPFPNLGQKLAQIRSLPDLSAFLTREFRFEEDKVLFGIEDRWQSPEEFWQRRSGDCEDYALFTQYLLRQMGIESYVVSFYGPHQFAHTLTVIKEEKGYSIMNENRYEAFHAPTIEAALTSVYPEWTWGGIAEKRGSRGWLLKKIQPLPHA